jgi:amino acid adenylation domain-containing protein/non-ribosomal peptide synthase protein (TIGR01720 family)
MSMRIERLLAETRAAGVALWAEAGELRYRAPKDGFAPDLLAQVKARRSELLVFLEGAKRAEDSAARLVARPHGGHAQMSFGQERLWLVEQLGMVGAAYQLPLVSRLEGSLDVAALERSLGELVRRHESLRTRFATRGGCGCVQVVDDARPFTLVVEDLGALPVDDRERRARDRQSEPFEPFDLERGPLFRARLLRLEPRVHVLVVTMHHIVTDGWSIGILMRELGALYGAYTRGEASPLADPALQYADYAVWQRQRLRGDVIDEQLAYWKRTLAGVEALELPTDRRRPAVQSFRGGLVPFAFPAALTQPLLDLARAEGATLFMVLLAGIQVVLSRWSGQTDIVVGTPTAGRTHPKTEELVGFFVNLLALRTDLSGAPSFREVLRRVKDVTLDAYAHQDVPFEKVVEALQPQRDLSRPPLFQVDFTLQNQPMEAPELAGLEVQLRDTVDHGSAQFDLAFLIEQRGGVLRGYVEHADLFDRSTVERVIDWLGRLLEGAVQAPGRSVRELPLLGAAERRRVVEEWNRTGPPGPRACLHERFAEQARRTPHAIAVEHDDERLTYGELERRANRLARHLVEVGVGPEVVVGLCVRRSVDRIVALLAILEAGGAYLPLDPNYPAERTSFMLTDARAAVLVTESALEDGLPAHWARVVSLDDHAEAIARCSPEALMARASAENLACILYTSGSTGTPKGVGIAHRNIVELVEPLDVTADDALLHLAPLAFDASTFEIWGALAHGARLVLAPEEADLSLVPDLIERCGVNVVFLTAGLFHQVVDLHLPKLAGVRTLLSGGDTLSVAHVRKVRDELPGCRMVNAYGPTECTTFSTLHPVERLGEDATSVPIGRPIPNTQAYVFDEHGEIAPIGAVGELYVGGSGLARGYVGRGAWTAERFVPHPFVAGERLYRTGDRVRWSGSGELEFLGRADQQVKVRGYRIELGEIESVLGAHPAVRHAVVVARADGPERPRSGNHGDKRLVGYVVAAEGEAPTSAKLREYLRQHLPEHMVPPVVVVLDALPLTSNGKVDRRALPAPEVRPEEGYVAPRGPTEEILAKIWADVLRQPRVGRHDNFFELGGDSIICIQIVARAHQAGLHLTPRHLFRHQSVAELAAVAGAGARIATEQGLVSGHVPLTPIQRWFFDQDLPERHHYNQAFLLEVPADLDPARVEQAVRHLVVHHDALRLRFADDGTQSHAGTDEPVPFSTVDLSAISEAHQRAAIEARAAEQQASLGIEHGPLLRVVHFALGPRRAGRLLWVVHHLAIDGVSWRVLLEDFERVHGQLARGEPVTLPPKTTSFKAWAERLHAYGRSEAARDELDHWLRATPPSVAPLPRDHASEDDTVASASTVTVTSSAELTRALLQEVPAAYHTQINDALLTALVQSFSRWTGASSLLVDLEGHGREDLFADVDLSRTVGWFTSLFPVCLTVDSQSPATALESVEEQLSRIPNKGVGYGILRYLHPDPEVSAALAALPAPEIGFNYLGQLDQTLTASSLIRPACESSGPAHGPSGSRPHLIEVTGWVVGGRLHFEWGFSERVHRRETVERLARGFVEALEALVAHSRSSGAGRTDFDLDSALAEIEFEPEQQGA